jgi:hypothetical protein
MNKLAGIEVETVSSLGNGRVDLRLRDGTAIDTKAFSNEFWRDAGPTIRQDILMDLTNDVHKYLADPNVTGLHYEFAHGIPNDILTVFQRLQGRYGTRLNWTANLAQP